MLRALPALPSFLLEEKKAKETSVIGLCKFYIAFSRGRRGTALAVDEAYYNVGEGYAGLRSNRGRRRRDGWGSPLPSPRIYRYKMQEFAFPLGDLQMRKCLQASPRREKALTEEHFSLFRKYLSENIYKGKKAIEKYYKI